MNRLFDYPARTICQCLDEMRALFDNNNYPPIRGLIEEVQMLANRMEARLETQRTYFEYRDEIRKQKELLTSLEKQVNLLQEIKEKK